MTFRVRHRGGFAWRLTRIFARSVRWDLDKLTAPRPFDAGLGRDLDLDAGFDAGLDLGSHRRWVRRGLPL
jgi:hypothetical protein